MKNGYYISAYIEISKIANLCYDSNRHDNCIALWYLDGSKVTLIHYWELERLTGVKQHRLAFYSIEQFKETINGLLMQYSITLDDIVQIWGVPQLNLNDEYLLKCRESDYTYHTICHITTCLLIDMERFRTKKILAFAIDGGSDMVVNCQNDEGESENQKYQFCFCYSDAKEDIFEVHSIFSPAVLWNIVSMYFNMREGTLMALASASTSTAYLDIDDILIRENVKSELIKYNQVIAFLEEIEGLTELDIGTKFSGFDPRFSERDNRISMAMKIIQRMSERIMKRNIDKAIKKYGIIPEDTYLALSGGYALNCPCNSYLMEEYGFKGMIAPPCVSDSGMALGIGLYAFYNKLGSRFDFQLKNAYYGEEDDVEAFLEKGTFSKFIESAVDFDIQQAIMDIETGPIVWFNGRAEIGPRALGNRSILGDPRKKETKDELNKIKKRQWWRPVAPIILYEEMGNWFERKCESPYMLHALKVKEDKSDKVPAVLHEDGSARVQTIDENTGVGILLPLMEAFFEKTGVPMLCNTSLNDKGEPIVNRIEEALNFALRKGMKIVYVNGKRINLKNHNAYEKYDPSKRALRIAAWQTSKEREKLWRNLNPQYVAESDIYMLYFYKKFLDDTYFLKEPNKITKEIRFIKYVLLNTKYTSLEYAFLNRIRTNIINIVNK